jgi:RHS repeat-associated protein
MHVRSRPALSTFLAALCSFASGCTETLDGGEAALGNLPPASRETPPIARAANACLEQFQLSPPIQFVTVDTPRGADDPLFDDTRLYSYIPGTDVHLSSAATAPADILTHDRARVSISRLLAGSPVFPFDTSFADEEFKPAANLGELFRRGLAEGEEEERAITFRVQLELTNETSLNPGSKPYYLVAEDKQGPEVRNVSVWQDGMGHLYVEAEVVDNCAVASVTVEATNSVGNALSPGGPCYPEMCGIGDDRYGVGITWLPARGTNTYTFKAVDAEGNETTYTFSHAVDASDTNGWNHFSTACPPGSAGVIGDPVNTSSGNFTLRAEDLVLPGTCHTEIAVVRGYNSMSSDAGPFGRGWTAPFGFRLERVDNLLMHGVKAHLPDGSTLIFHDQGGGSFVTASPGAEDELTFDGGAYVLRRKTLETYRFDAQGRLTRVTDANGNTQSLRYEGGRLARIENSMGRWVELEHDADGRVTVLRAPEGVVLRYGYEAGRLSQFTDARGQTWRYTYGEGGRLASVLTPEGHPSLRLRYGEHGHVEELIEGESTRHSFSYEWAEGTHTITDAEGRTEVHRYDLRSRLIEATDARGFAESYGYDDDDRRTFLRDKAGREWRWDFDDRGNQVREQGPLGWERAWEYDERDKRTLARDALGRETRYRYDERGNLVSVRDPLGGETAIVVDERGLPVRVTDAAGRTHERTYDEHGDLVEERDAAGAVARFGYDGLGRKVREVRPSGAEYAYAYDGGSALVIERRSPLGLVERWAHDGNGNLVSRTDGNGHATTYAYDASERRVRVVDPLGHATTFAYGPMGELVARTDAEGHATAFAHDESYRVVREDAPEGATTHAAYDARGLVAARTDPEGRVTRFVRDDLDRVVEEVRNAIDGAPEGPDVNVRRRFAYDLAGNLVSLTDPRGVVTTYAYDALDRRVEEVRAARPGEAPGADVNVTRRFEYDAVGNLVRSIDPLGRATRHGHDPVNRLAETIDALGQVTRRSYDGNGNLVESVDAEGRVTRHEYDALDRRVATVANHDPAAGAGADVNVTTRFSYDLASQMRFRTDPRGGVTEYRYDAARRLVEVIDPAGHATHYGHDRVGRVASSADPLGNTTRHRYDGLGRTTSTVDPAGHETRLEYDRAGNVVRRIDARGGVTVHAYDALDRLVRTTDALGGVTSSSYDRADNLLARVDPNGHATSWTHDALGRTVSRTDAEGHVTRFSHDAAGNQVAAIDGNGHVRAYAHDALDRRERETNPEGETVEHRYDRVGNEVARVAPDGVVTRYEYDGVYRLAAVTLNRRPGAAADAQTNVTYRYAHDAGGNLVAVIDPRGAVRSYEYDARGLRVREIDPLGHAWVTEHDPAGRRSRRTDPNGRVTLYHHDADGLPALAAYDDGTSIAYAHDPNHNRRSMVDALGTSAWTYDALDRMTAVTDALGRTLAYGYDAAGNRTSVVYPEGSVVRTSYFANDWLEAVEAPGGVSARYERDGVGQMVRLLHSNDTSVEASYDRAGRLLALVNWSDDGDVIAAFAYDYDQAGLRTSVTSTYGWRNPAVVSEVFAYDPLRRLVAVIDGEGYEAGYAYDAASNRTRWTAGDDLTTSTPGDGFDLTYDYDLAGRLLRAGDAYYDYDANGNRVRATWSGPSGPPVQGFDYAYDHEDRLVAARAFQIGGGGQRTDRALTELAYDGDGRRLLKTHDSHAGGGGARRTEYLFDRRDPVAFYDPPTRKRDEIYRAPGSELVARRSIPAGTPGQTYWYHHDGRGNVAGLTKQHGQSTHNYRYDAFGEPLPEHGNFTDPHNPLAFVGQEWDEDLGLYELDHRVYDPRAGVFLTQDPVRGDPARPLTLHRYGYAFSSPLSYHDRHGLLAAMVAGDLTHRHYCDSQSLLDLLTEYGVSLPAEQGTVGWKYGENGFYDLIHFQNAVAVLMGVTATANALYAANPSLGSDAKAVFNAVFGGNITFQEIATLSNGICSASGAGAACELEDEGTDENGDGDEDGNAWPGHMYLVVHELGHVFNAHVQNGINDGGIAADDPYAMLSLGISFNGDSLSSTADSDGDGVADVIDGTAGVIDGDGFNQYSQSDDDGPGYEGEVFADMFLNWVFGSFPTDEAGTVRQGWMDVNMPDWTAQATHDE